MTTPLPRRSVIAAALVAPVAGVRAQSGAMKPLVMSGKSTLYQRILTHPGAMLSAQPDGAGAKPVLGFQAYYVYDKKGGDTGWMRVGKSATGPIEGWIPAAKTIEWRQSLVGAFTNPAGRDPVLFLDTKRAENDLLLDGQPGDAARRMLADAKAGRAGHVVAREPDGWANIDDRFYLMPILSSERIEHEFRPASRLLEVVTARMPDPPPAPKPFKAAVVFLVDTTMSMQRYIDGTRDVIRKMVGDIRSTDMGDSFRFGLVAYRDSLQDTQGLEYDAQVYAKPDFSQSVDAILPAIAQVREARTSSNGFDEDPIGGLKTAITQIDWSNISNGFRHLVLITDAGARPGNHPHSMTQMDIAQVKNMAVGSNICIWTLHLLTEEGARRSDHVPAAKQYKELSAWNAEHQTYFPIGEPPSRFASQELFVSQALHITEALLDISAKTSGRPVPKINPASGPVPPRLEQQLAFIEQAMKLSYFGHTQAESLEYSRPAAAAVRSFTTDRDLVDSAKQSLEVRVLLTKNQLSDLASTLQELLRAGRAGSLAPQSFFDELQKRVASAFRDPQQIREAKKIGSLLGEFLDDLPYTSELLRITPDEWSQMSSIERDKILNRIDSKLALYRAYEGRREQWYKVDKDNPGEDVFPVPIEDLP